MAKPHLRVATATTGATYTPSVGLGASGAQFELTAGANLTIAAPTGVFPGQILAFTILQNGTGGWTLAFASVYKLAAAVSNTGNTAGKATSFLFIVSPRSTASALVIEQIGSQQPYH